MRQLYKLFLAVTICLGSVSAQSFIGEINPFPSKPIEQILSNDTIKILAVMVNFTDDKDESTFGNGKFGSIYTQNYGNTIIDPLPHDDQYFESHLQFAKNYFQKVSGGMSNISFTILPDTFSVSKPMRNYSPETNSSDFTLIASFAEEVWRIADQNNPGFNFSDYDLFIIFHAGVGRDVTLPGSLGTERDIPSVYLSTNALKNIYGETFEGFPVSGGSFKILNSMIIPETESREVSSFGSVFLFELSINGLLVASIASHLGLPDLFDTETGLSAIGRFGLMDGQSIFAYNGLFPPEPSAWEKIYLGWKEPIVVEPGVYNLSLTSNTVASLSDTVILKVPLTSSEYYLVENRTRDAYQDGANISYKIGDVVFNKYFEKDTAGFYSFQTDSIDGVVVDVDEFDWALPGSGILIWHIDENIIDLKIADNKINTDKKLRGVDVEEADGVQDIGETFFTIFGDEVIGEGTEEDFWHKDNPADLFKNRFSKDTYPNTNTNSNANSLITFSDFSSISNRMSFNLTFGDSIIKPIFYKQLNINGQNHLTSSGGSDFRFALLNNQDLLIIDETGNVKKTLTNFSDYKVASTSIIGSDYFVGALNNTLNVYMTDGQLEFFKSVDVGNPISTAPVLVNLLGETIIKIITVDSLKDFSLGSLPSTPPVQISSIKLGEQQSIYRISFAAGRYSYLAEVLSDPVPEITKYKFVEDTGFSYEFVGEKPGAIATTFSRTGEFVSVVLIGQKFYIFSEGKLLKILENSGWAPLFAFSIGDIKNDGENYIIFVNGNKIEAINFAGASADNFPFEDPNHSLFFSTPLTADIDGTNHSEVIAHTEDGRIFAIDGATGKIIPGFPISAGSFSSGTPSIFVDGQNKISLAYINSGRSFSAWEIGPTEGTKFWTEEFGSNLNTASIEAASIDNSINEFFPVNRAYNYPNPVYDGSTNIRYFVSENAKINIKIFDLAGDFVDELNDEAQGGFDNETIWDVGNIQSGVYLARIEAVGSSGKTESAIIKIAVVK